MLDSKIFIKLAFSMLSAVLMFTGCGNDNGTGPSGSDLIGTWEMTKITAEVSGVSMTATPEEADIYITLIIKSDNTIEMIKIQGSITESETGTWNTSEKKLILQGNEGSTVADYTTTGNKLIITYWEEETFYTIEFTKK